MTNSSKQARIEKLIKKQKMAMFFAPAIVKRKHNMLDKAKLWLLQRITPKAQPKNDFMRDEICDAEPEFSVEDLKAFRERR